MKLPKLSQGVGRGSSRPQYVGLNRLKAAHYDLEIFDEEDLEEEGVPETALCEQECRVLYRPGTQALRECLTVCRNVFDYGSEFKPTDS